MGDQNGVAIAQETHEAILVAGGCMRDGDVMRYSRSTPEGMVWEAAYVDDHHVSLKLPRARLSCQPGEHVVTCQACGVDGGLLPVVKIVNQSCASYQCFWGAAERGEGVPL